MLLDEDGGCLRNNLSMHVVFHSFQFPTAKKLAHTLKQCCVNLSMWFVVMNIIRASVDATPSSALRRPLYVRVPIPS